MKVAVAGGSGFVGRHLAQALRESGQQVLVLDRGTRALPEGATRIVCDLARGPLPAHALDGCGAVVNLVGIKRAHGSQTFAAAHVAATTRLVEAARAAGIRRFVHVSVVCSRPDAASPYHDTKWRAEQALQGSGLDLTVLRPAVIYGRGDDMTSHLVKMIRFAPLFPVVGGGASLLQPVDVRDVAAAVVAALRRPAAIGRTYDVVGPERLTLRRVVEMVATGLALPLRIVPTPRAFMRPAVALASAMTARALSTPAQLRMLEEGLLGDPEPARRDLGLHPRTFTAEAARAAAEGIGPLFGWSLRLSGGGAAAERPRDHAPQAARAALVVAAALTLLPLLGRWIPQVWPRLAVNTAVVMPLALLAVRLPWRRLFAPSARRIGAGVAAAAVLYAMGAAVFRLLETIPWAASQIASLYAWRDAAPDGWAIPLLLWIVLGEEVVWRTAVTLPLADRFGPRRGTALAAAGFAAAHVSLGVPLLLVVALAAGAFWSALVVSSRNVVPALVSHLLWDMAVLFLWPYG